MTKKLKLESISFYKKEDVSVSDYQNAQRHRHSRKHGKCRHTGFYKSVSDEIDRVLEHVKGDMICLGTRNNWERDTFKKYLGLETVYSSDIAPRSKADHILDFNKMPEKWHGTWDILYSNAVDHALNATDVFYEWLKVVKVGGHMVLGFGVDPHISISDKKLSKSDCNLFEDKQLFSFFESQDEVTVLSTKNIDSYLHFFLKRTK